MGEEIFTTLLAPGATSFLPVQFTDTNAQLYVQSVPNNTSYPASTASFAQGAVRVPLPLSSPPPHCRDIGARSILVKLPTPQVRYIRACLRLDNAATAAYWEAASSGDSQEGKRDFQPFSTGSISLNGSSARGHLRLISFHAPLVINNLLATGVEYRIVSGARGEARSGGSKVDNEPASALRRLSLCSSVASTASNTPGGTGSLVQGDQVFWYGAGLDAITMAVRLPGFEWSLPMVIETDAIDESAASLDSAPVQGKGNDVEVSSSLDGEVHSGSQPRWYRQALSSWDVPAQDVSTFNNKKLAHDDRSKDRSVDEAVALAFRETSIQWEDFLLNSEEAPPQVSTAAAAAAALQDHSRSRQIWLRVRDPAGIVLEVCAEIKICTTGSREISLFVPFWVVNRSGLPLQLQHGRTHELVAGQHATKKRPSTTKLRQLLRVRQVSNDELSVNSVSESFLRGAGPPPIDGGMLQLLPGWDGGAGQRGREILADNRAALLQNRCSGERHTFDEASSLLGHTNMAGAWRCTAGFGDQDGLIASARAPGDLQALAPQHVLQVSIPQAAHSVSSRMNGIGVTPVELRVSERGAASCWLPLELRSTSTRCDGPGSSLPSESHVILLQEDLGVLRRQSPHGIAPDCSAAAPTSSHQSHHLVKREYAMGLRVQNARGKYWRTRVVTILPRLVLLNNLEQDIEVMQVSESYMLTSLISPFLFDLSGW
jgi:hypothetical protein